MDATGLSFARRTNARLFSISRRYYVNKQFEGNARDVRDEVISAALLKTKSAQFKLICAVRSLHLITTEKIRSRLKSSDFFPLIDPSLTNSKQRATPSITRTCLRNLHLSTYSALQRRGALICASPRKILLLKLDVS